MLNVDATNQPIYVFTADMSLLLEQTSNRGEWAVPCLQTGMSLFTLSHFATLGWILFSMNKHTFMSQLSWILNLLLCRLTARTRRISSRWPRRRWLASRRRRGRKIRFLTFLGKMINFRYNKLMQISLFRQRSWKSLRIGNIWQMFELSRKISSLLLAFRQGKPFVMQSYCLGEGIQFGLGHLNSGPHPPHDIIDQLSTTFRICRCTKWLYQVVSRSQ